MSIQMNYIVGSIGRGASRVRGDSTTSYRRQGALSEPKYSHT